jgi:hypothetical protein
VRIDQDYLKKLLEACEAAPAPIFDIKVLEAAGLDFDTDEFVFHMSILNDLGVVERDGREPGFGLVRGADGYVSWAVLPLRLTAQGHQFIEALRNKEVWATIKRVMRRWPRSSRSTSSTLPSNPGRGLGLS